MIRSSGNMRAIVLIALMSCICLPAMAAIQEPPEVKDLDPRPNGEPGPAMTQVYVKEFRVKLDDYFSALNEFYSFARVQVFEQIEFTECFSSILDRTKTRDVPCVGVFAVKGSPPKAHMTFSVVAKSTNTTLRDAYLTCRIGIYVHSTYKPVQGL